MGKGSKALFNKGISAFVAISLIASMTCGTPSYGLATLPASQNSMSKREIMTTLHVNNIQIADDPGEIRLINANNSDAVLLTSGVYLFREEAPKTNIGILKTLISADIKALFRIIASEQYDTYDSIRKMVLDEFPCKEENYPAINAHIEDILARFFSWTNLNKMNVLEETEVPEEDLRLIKKLMPLVMTHNYMFIDNGFWDIEKRHKRISSAIRKGVRIYAIEQENGEYNYLKNLNLHDPDKGPPVNKKKTERLIQKHISNEKVKQIRNTVQRVRDMGAALLDTGESELNDIFEGAGENYGRVFDKRRFPHIVSRIQTACRMLEEALDASNGQYERFKNALQRKRKPVFIITGPPATGKSKYSKHLAKTLGLTRIETGDSLRLFVRNNPEDPEAIKIAEIMKKGDLVSDEIIVGLIKKRILESHENTSGIIFDGFPRKKSQIETLNRMLEELNMEVYKVLGLNASDEALDLKHEARIKKKETEGVPARPDESREVFKQRVKASHEFEKTLKEMYGQKLLTVDIENDTIQYRVIWEIFKNIKQHGFETYDEFRSFFIDNIDDLLCSGRKLDEIYALESLEFVREDSKETILSVDMQKHSAILFGLIKLYQKQYFDLGGMKNSKGDDREVIKFLLQEVEKNLGSIDVPASMISQMIWRLSLPRDNTDYLEVKGEVLDVIDPNSEIAKETIIGITDRNIAEAIGLTHRASNIIVISNDGQFLVSQRAGFKKFGEEWTICGGHPIASKKNVDAREAYLAAAVQEFLEETGLYPSSEMSEELKQGVTRRMVALGTPGSHIYDKPSDLNRERRALYAIILSEEETRRLKRRMSELEDFKNSDYGTNLSEALRVNNEKLYQRDMWEFMGMRLYPYYKLSSWIEDPQEDILNEDLFAFFMKDPFVAKRLRSISDAVGISDAQLNNIMNAPESEDSSSEFLALFMNNPDTRKRLGYIMDVALIRYAMVNSKMPQEIAERMKEISKTKETRNEVYSNLFAGAKQTQQSFEDYLKQSDNNITSKNKKEISSKMNAIKEFVDNSPVFRGGIDGDKVETMIKSCLQVVYSKTPTKFFWRFFTSGECDTFGTPGHQLSHALDDLLWSLQILDATMDQEEASIVSNMSDKDYLNLVFASILHDITCVYCREKHSITSELFINSLLKNTKFEDTADNICKIAAAHHGYEVRETHGVDVYNNTATGFLAKVLKDADTLDNGLHLERIYNAGIATRDYFWNKEVTLEERLRDESRKFPDFNSVPENFQIAYGNTDIAQFLIHCGIRHRIPGNFLSDGARNILLNYRITPKSDKLSLVEALDEIMHYFSMDDKKMRSGEEHEFRQMLYIIFEDLALRRLFREVGIQYNLLFSVSRQEDKYAPERVEEAIELLNKSFLESKRDYTSFTEILRKNSSIVQKRKKLYLFLKNNRFSEADKKLLEDTLLRGNFSYDLFENGLINRIFGFIELLPESDLEHVKNVVAFTDILSRRDIDGFLAGKLDPDNMRKMDEADIEPFGALAKTFIEKHGESQKTRRAGLIYLTALLHDLGKAVSGAGHNELSYEFSEYVFSMLSENGIHYEKHERELVASAALLHDSFGNLLLREKTPEWILSKLPDDPLKAQDVLDLTALITMADIREPANGRRLTEENAKFFYSNTRLDQLKSPEDPGLKALLRIREWAKYKNGLNKQDGAVLSDYMDQIEEAWGDLAPESKHRLNRYFGKNISVFEYGFYIFSALGTASRENLVKFCIYISRVCEENGLEEVKNAIVALEYDYSIRFNEGLAEKAVQLSNSLDRYTYKEIESLDLESFTFAKTRKTADNRVVIEIVDDVILSNNKDQVPFDLYASAHEDMESVITLKIDNIRKGLIENRKYIIEYDQARISEEYEAIIRTYSELLEKKTNSSVNLRPFKQKNSSKDRPLIKVTCTGAEHSGTGSVDVVIMEGELNDYIFRITGFLNIAVAASNIPEDVEKTAFESNYSHLIGFIKDQYKKIMLGKDINLTGSFSEQLVMLRNVHLILPKAYRMSGKIKEYNDIVFKLLTAA